jgi:hypothetical protein
MKKELVELKVPTRLQRGHVQWKKSLKPSPRIKNIPKSQQNHRPVTTHNGKLHYD